MSTTHAERSSAERYPAALDAGIALVRPALRAAVRDYLCHDTELVAGYHHGWSDEQGRPTEEWSGKLVRPSLALLSARSAGADPADGVAAAVAVELVHNFSLLHDDIMDNDSARRGRATAWTLFGVPRAILTGDALLAAATGVLLDSGKPGAGSAANSLATATRRMISGQAADVEFERRDDVTLDECLRMAGDKTGALLSCACSIGAELLGADAEPLHRLARFGEHLGVAFQLVDDQLGIWGDPERTGKQVLADIRVRKKSLPLVFALNESGSDELSALYHGSEPLEERQVRRVAELVERAGGREWAHEELARRVVAARECLEHDGLSPSVREELLEMAAFLTDRRF
ncbi:geranylgeranyl diphosphate synthase type I [Actinopolyspora lacussalsi]|nr:geranylgeranyl diphosphate synthase type I [Actinopolyspora lacussalsi]